YSSFTAPTDQVVPPRFFDDTPMHRAFILHAMFVFNDVLDPRKIHESLEAVVKREGWRRLGARLRRNENGQLEYHVPASFNQHRPAIKFSHIDYGTMDMKDHPVASRLPKASSQVAALANPDEFQVLSRNVDSPRSLQDYIDGQEPQLGLHVVSFSDATLVSLICPHNLVDGMGIIAVCQARTTLALQGRHKEIPETYPVDSDPLAELGRHPVETHKLSKRLMSLFDMVCYGLGNLDSIVVPDLERRIVCVPAPFLASLRRQAFLELKADDPGGKDLFLSEGDVLCAWWTRLCAAAQVVRNSTRTVAFYNTHSLKGALARDLLRLDRPYLGNAFQLIAVLFKATDLLKRPLGSLANQIRQSTKELSSRGQVEAFAALWRASRFRLIPCFGDSGMLIITCSNWTKTGVFDIDLSAAISRRKHQSDARAPSRRGRPSFVYHNRLGSDALIGPNVLIIMGKDGDGNYWLDGCARRKYWGKMEELLAAES
ncbi:hypothetical protein CP533_1402, partial [Ophiocordyceps camponoti-saundersi (nom. inval.)]